MSYKTVYLPVILLTVTMFIFGGCATPPPAEITKEPIPDFNAPVEFEPIKVSGLSPASLKEATLKPGLDALYYAKFFKRDLKHLPKGKSAEYATFRKEPILELNHQFGKENVFGANSNRGIGIRMTGYLRFPEAGVYELQALSNDGVILYLDGQLVLSDPKQHSDRLSNLGIVTIDKSGLYPLTVEYFQRKGTAALKLFWKKPGDSEQTPVPASAYNH